MPQLDNVQHGYLLTEPAQVEYDAEGGARRARFAGAVARAYAHMDAIVASWITASPLTDFVVVSDHGMLPAHSTVLLNRVLDEAGLRTRYPHPQVRAFSSGGSAQIYVNAQSKFRDGVVRDEDIPAVVARVVDVCRAVRDPATGKPVFTTVASGADLVALHLDNRNAGDVYVSADAGWSISDRVDSLLPTFAPNTLNPATRARLARTPAEAAFLADGRYNEISLGVHGHRPGDPRLQAVFMAVGPHVPHLAGGVRDMVDVAPTVLELLGIPRPAHMAGHAPFLGLSP
jgi:predicted AlkP superfamily phosphohydrolase/phosphomutase